ATLAACSPNPVPAVQGPPLEKPAQPTLGTLISGVPAAADVFKIIPIPGTPGTGQNPPSNNTLNQTFSRMSQSATATFDSFSRSPEWLDMGRFITNTFVTTGPGMLFNPNSVVELARAQTKAQQSGGTLSRGNLAGQALSSEARNLMGRISALAAASGTNPLPSGTWKPRVGTKAGNPANWEQVSANPTDGVKFEAMDSGKKFTLETQWRVGGKATQSVPLELGPIVLSQELPVALKTTLSIDTKVVLELTANVDYGTCLTKLGPVSLDLTLKAPSGLDVTVKYARSRGEVSGSIVTSLVSGGQSVSLDSSGALKGSFVQDAACGIKVVPSSYNTSSSLKAGLDSFEAKLNVVNIKGWSLNSADATPTLESVDGFVSASAQLNNTVMLSAYGPLEDTNKDKIPGDKLEIKFSNGDNLYSTTLEALLKSNP
ncbi:MAG: hypothetical protein H7095_06440, partial [Pseudopedobacter sp.]|nr:hypothetical protein [Deinococcales bacterium]